MGQGRSLPLAGRAAFVGAVTRAGRERRPYAAGKLGGSEKYWLYYDMPPALRPPAGIVDGGAYW